MREVSFLTTPSFSELSIETGKVYTVRYMPDQSIVYLVNFAVVEQLPVTPAAKELLAVAKRLTAKIQRLYTVPFDGTEYRSLWWEIKDEIKSCAN